MRWNKSSKSLVLSNQHLGDIGEQLAAKYLVDRGLCLLNSKFTCRFGEIDLIMKEQSTIVFIEVKYRKNNAFGGAIAAVTQKKQKKIAKSAAFYLQHCGLKEYNTPCRFDVLAIIGNINEPNITWLKNAFNEKN